MIRAQASLGTLRRINPHRPRFRLDHRELPRCVRVREGQHRIQFQWGSERSPDYLITVAKEHTADNPLRASYNFKDGRFVSSAE